MTPLQIKSRIAVITEELHSLRRLFKKHAKPKDKLQPSRWGPIRRCIHDMGPRSTITFPRSHYHNCYSTVMRLNDAYVGECVWKLKNYTEITRTK